MASTPEPPDPMETAQTQSSMNRDTAITQHLLNMVNQVTPDGSLTYSQSGQFFQPSKTGDTYWFNSKTGEYTQKDPFAGASSGKPTSVPTVGLGNDGNGMFNNAGKKGAGSAASKPAGTGDWEQVTGNLTPTWTATTTLSPEQQKIYDQINKSKLNLSTTAAEQSEFLRKYLSKGLDTSGVPEQWAYLGKKYNSDLGPDYSTNVGPGYVTSYAGADDFSADRQKVEDALMARQQPGLAQDEERIRAQLINAGLRPGSEGFNAEMDRLSRNTNDARMAAILGAGEEQARMVGMARDAAAFGNESILARMQAQNQASMGKKTFENSVIMDKANFQNNSRATALNELYAERARPLNEITALLSGSQNNTPQFVNTPQTSVAGVDYSGMVSDNYKAQVANSNAQMGGLFGLLSAPFSMFKFSDRRLKKDIQRLGERRNGLPWYQFRYIWEDASSPLHEGVMSDDVRRLMPDKPEAIKVDGGYDMVDYSKILEAA